MDIAPMMREEIIIWMKTGRPFDKGVELYQKYGKHKGLIVLFQSGYNRYTGNQLNKALESLAAQPEHIPNPSKHVRVQDAAASGAIAPPKAPEEKPHPEIARLEKVLKDLYRNRSNLHSKMKASRSQKTRMHMAFDILAIGDEIREHLAAIKYIKQYNKLPPSLTTLKVSDITDRAELMKRLNANRSYISKNKARTDKADEVERRKTENEEIETLLNGNDPTA